MKAGTNTPAVRSETAGVNAGKQNMDASKVGVNPNVNTDVQNVLARTVQAAVSKGDFDTLVSNLTKADQDRLASAKNQNWADLDGRIDQFRKDWQAKYGQDFNVNDKVSVVFNDQGFPITQNSGMSSDATDRARTASGTVSPSGNSMDDTRITNPNTGTSTTGNGSAANSSDVNKAQNISGTGSQQRGGDIKSEATKNDADRVDRNGRPIDPGHGKDTQMARQLGQAAGTGVGGAPAEGNAGLAADTDVRTACVKLPADANASAANVNLKNEGTLISAWRIDLPDNVDAQKLHDNLLNHLTKLDENKANWPTDVNQAYQAVSHDILAAISDNGTTKAEMKNQ